MKKIWTRDSLSSNLKISIFIIGIAFVLGIVGCTGLQGQHLSWLQGTPIKEIAPSRLTCETHPEIVDGNLETVATFIVRGKVTKKHGVVEGGRRGRLMNRYVTDLDGTIRCEILIKLEKPMYVSTVEVYPASRIPNLALSTTLKESGYHLGQSGIGFEPVLDKQHKDVEGKKPVKFSVAREVRYLRVTADAIEDRQNATRVGDEEINIPLKGAAIREVKLYGKQTS